MRRDEYKGTWDHIFSLSKVGIGTANRLARKKKWQPTSLLKYWIEEIHVFKDAIA